MVDASRVAVASQLAATETELSELAAMAGKNRSMAQVMVARLEVDKKNYQSTVQTFRATVNTVTTQGAALMKQLDAEHIEEILNKDRKFIEDAWTTAGLWKNMQSLFQHFTGASAKILNFANQIRSFVDATYAHFHEKFGFARLSPPALNLEKHTLAMTGMQETAREFCHNPVNTAKYKDFVVKRFYESLVGEARQIFELTRGDAESWLKSALNPLNLQIKEHEKVLAKRIENFKKIRDNIGSVEDRMKQLEKVRMALQDQTGVLSGIKTSLDGDNPATPAPQRPPEPPPGPAYNAASIRSQSVFSIAMRAEYLSFAGTSTHGASVLPVRSIMSHTARS